MRPNPIRQALQEGRPTFGTHIFSQWPTIEALLRAGVKMFRKRYGKPNALVAAGGVAANQAIRKVLHQVAFETGAVLVVPQAALCTDNGAMIAWAGAGRRALGQPGRPGSGSPAPSRTAHR